MIKEISLIFVCWTTHFTEHKSLKGSPMCFFLFKNKCIPLCVFTFVYPFIHSAQPTIACVSLTLECTSHEQDYINIFCETLLFVFEWPLSELLDYNGNSVLVRGIALYFRILLFYIPTNDALSFSFSAFLHRATVLGVVVVLICIMNVEIISLLAVFSSDVKHLSLCSLAIWASSWKNLFKPCPF